jgi:hypothetical protein
MIHHRVMPLVLAAVLPGCLVLTKDRLTEKEHKDAWQQTPVSERKLTYGGRANGTGVDVWSAWEQLCDFRGERMTSYNRHTGARFYMLDICDRGDECFYGWFFEALAAPFTIPISGLITAGIVIGSRDDTVVKKTALSAHRGSCGVVAPNVTLSVGAPGREPTLVTTDGRGRGFVDLGDPNVANEAQVTLVP